MVWLKILKYISIFLIFLVLLSMLFEKSSYSINFSSLGEVNNFVTEIYLKNRLYDTIFEVLVFSLAALGVLLFNFSIELNRIFLHEEHIRILLRFLSFFVMLSSFYLAYYGHITPGGGFSAGVAGGTALLLYALSTTISEFEHFFHGFKVKLFEKIFLFFIYIFSVVTFFEGTSFWQINNIILLNILIYLKVMFGTWIILYSFIKHRGII
ncbi:MnhB domain-containing protein [Thermosipho atlanticus]|uniref:Multisubunit sodium/proton antiporter, MrpB subunit n=1 Tax=Thermosipho atlanticus DSM 15807 TaxID=1123380 RepID=A0A1M5QZH8_9BACT|nr:MnhB domain-containing protein [Thermosipho atlanticus]SHH19577.1 multisubunit sodium/proton antiporter, MrpB subunit [Thermosipho atlanticus DSM 15807]